MKFGKVLACRTRRAGEPQDEGTIERIAASRIAEQAEGRPPRLGQSPRECCHRVVRPRSADADNGDGGRRRSEGRRGGTECGSKCCYRWAPVHYKNKTPKDTTDHTT